MTHPDFERDRAEAQAVYDRMMMETHMIVMQARAPISRPAPASFGERVASAFKCCRAALLAHLSAVPTKE